MQELMNSLTEQQKLVIGDELEKLYALQDRPLGKEKLAFLLEEMATLNIPAGAWISGIRSLMSEDLKSVKLAHLYAAAKKFTVAEEAKTVRCDYCSGCGAVGMRDPEHRSWSLACICPNAEKLKKAWDLVRWNGEQVQISKGRRLVLTFNLQAMHEARDAQC